MSGDNTYRLLHQALEIEDLDIDRIRRLTEEARDYRDGKDEAGFMALDEACELITQAQEALQAAAQIFATRLKAEKAGG